MKPKNDAAVICPNCGTELVKMRFETDDGWIHGWLCECKEGTEQDDTSDVDIFDVAPAIRNFSRALQAKGLIYDPQASG